MATITKNEPRPTYTLELTEGEALFLKLHLSMTDIDADRILIDTAYLAEYDKPTEKEIISVWNQLLDTFGTVHNNVICTVEIV